VNKFQEIDGAQETEITTWKNKSKILKERKTIQDQTRSRNAKRSGKNQITTEAPYGAVTEGYIQNNVKPQARSTGIEVSQKQNHQL